MNWTLLVRPGAAITMSASKGSGSVSVRVTLACWSEAPVKAGTGAVRAGYGAAVPPAPAGMSATGVPAKVWRTVNPADARALLLTRTS